VQAIVGRRSYSGGGYIAASAQTHGGESLITIAQDHGKANIVRYLQDQLMQSSRGASYAPPAPGPLDPLDQFSIITDATPAQWRAMREQYNAQTNPNRASIRTALTKLNQALNAGDAALQRAIVHQHAMLFNRVPMLQDALGNPR
jgi:hypothetical protein